MACRCNALSWPRKRRATRWSRWCRSSTPSLSATTSSTTAPAGSCPRWRPGGRPRRSPSTRRCVTRRASASSSTTKSSGAPAATWWRAERRRGECASSASSGEEKDAARSAASSAPASRPSGASSGGREANGRDDRSAPGEPVVLTDLFQPATSGFTGVACLLRSARPLQPPPNHRPRENRPARATEIPEEPFREDASVVRGFACKHLL